ncbi:hypothetical protein C8J57DRAFT_1253140 [Mycena rebaudengoi]|nr:hypothetical protein C8J57DRAFT_1253140 [Mycena rebaudengoi]
MLSRLTIALAAALVSLSTGAEVVLTNCAVCPPTLFYQGLTCTLTVPMAATCSYREADGHLMSIQHSRRRVSEPRFSHSEIILHVRYSHYTVAHPFYMPERWLLHDIAAGAVASTATFFGTGHIGNSMKKEWGREEGREKC